MSEPHELERQDIEALGATRAELGAAYEPALLDNFADKVEASIQRRVDQELASRRHGAGVDRTQAALQFALAMASIVAAIPISIVAAVQGELLIFVVTWLGIIAVNVAHAMRGRSL